MSQPWPLPAKPFVPGHTARPTASPAFEAAAAAPARTDPDLWAKNTTYLYGAALYQAGFFWEAHEVWEPVWMHAAPNSRARALMQGLIQLANACLKVRMGRLKAAHRLLDQTGGHLGAAGTEQLMGLAPATLALDVQLFQASGAEDLTQRPAIIPIDAL